MKKESDRRSKRESDSLLDAKTTNYKNEHVRQLVMK